MRRFRPIPVARTPAPDPFRAGQLIDELLQPGHFYVAPSLRLQWRAPEAEEVPWEIFRGRLVAHTRQRARFLAWHITDENGAALLSARLDVHAGIVHVTRGILSYVWEGYDAGDNVIQSREVERWVTELVGSVELARFADLDELGDELVCLFWQAVVGTSRLPLHSVEAPLPAFTFGQLHYVYRPWETALDEPMRDWRPLLHTLEQTDLSLAEQARLLEFVLRQVPLAEIAGPAAFFRATPARADRLLRAVFNSVSLSPYTDFAHTALAFVRAALPVPEQLAFLSHLLRQLTRHLTAYDLVRFHHAGANYPDALLLDQVLGAYLELVQRVADSFSGNDAPVLGRRRALRQALLVRHRYEGHLVPELPTSPGENARVLPAPHRRVADEQLTLPHRRPRRLYADDHLATWRRDNRLGALALDALVQSLRDLTQSAELLELGIGLFIDRPLGYAKEAGEPDYTPLLAHEAFSRTLARRRLRELAQLAAALALDLPGELFPALERALDELPVQGVPAERLAEPARPTTALADVRRVADDFVIVRTLPGGVRELLDLLALPPLPQPLVVVNIQTPRGRVLTFFAADYSVALEAIVDTSAGYVRRAGSEWPVAGVRLGAG